MSANSSSATSGPSLDINLFTMFVSKKKQSDLEHNAIEQSPNMIPTNFQVSANIDEESRRDSQLNLSFVVTLNDSRGLVTYEFRGKCRINGSSAEFSSLLEAEKNKVPKILDVIYQRLYPLVFMMSGATSAPYPQSVALASQMMVAPHQTSAPPTPEDKIVQAIQANYVESKKEQLVQSPSPAASATKKAEDKISPTNSENKKTPPQPKTAPSGSPIGGVPVEAKATHQPPTKEKPKSTIASAQ